MDSLSALNVAELIAELCVWIEDVTVGRDLDLLIMSITTPRRDQIVSTKQAARRIDLCDDPRAAARGGELVCVAQQISFDRITTSTRATTEGPGPSNQFRRF